MKIRSLILTLFLLALIASIGFTFFKKPNTADSMSATAEAYLATLTDEQRAKSQLDYDTPKRLDWHFIPKPTRKGMVIREMNEKQRKAAHALLKASLSEIGYDKSVKIMELEAVLAHLEGDKEFKRRDPLKYYVTIFGEPAEKGRWGFSFEGHHLSFNWVVDDGIVVSSSPQFLATNPGTVMNDVPNVPKGQRVLAKEEQLGFDLVNSLTDEQKAKAIIADKAPREIRAAGEPQPPQDKPVGLSASEMNDDQREILEQLIDEYINTMPADVASSRRLLLKKAGLHHARFAWAGATKPGVGHYYRIEGTTFLIELVNTQPDAAGNPANHVHCVWRNPRGDFGVSID